MIRHERGIVEGGSTDGHPLPQPITARVLERYTGLVNVATRRLTGDQDPGSRMHLDDWTRPMGQVRCTNRARSDLPKENLQGPGMLHCGALKRPVIPG